MAQDIVRPPDPDVAEEPDAEQEQSDGDRENHDDKRAARLTRRVHIVVGLVIAALGGWLLYKSRTELAFRGANNEPGPGYLPVLLTIGLIALGLALTAVWLFGAKARHGDAPTLSLHPRQMGRALVVWAALVVSALVIEPLGFLLAGEVLVLLVMVIERMRSIPLIVTLLLVPPAMYVLFDTLLEVQLPGGTLWY
ncbi:MAG TPA: tripartite tricarboxylate transporter TctB family protein [Mycobacterium sp.]|nr:tripartite tricarboxylate transporter TctB family protein [Mycobacterium sp.]